MAIQKSKVKMPLLRRMEATMADNLKFSDAALALLKANLGYYDSTIPADLLADAIDTSFDVPQLYGSRRARNVAVTTAGGKTVNLTIYTQKLTDADISMLLNLVNEKLGEDL